MRFVTGRIVLVIACTLGSGTAQAAGYYHVNFFGDTPQGALFSAIGLNNAGQVTGDMAVLGIGTHAFLYSPGGVYTDLGAPAGFFSRGYAVNELGWVAGMATVNDQGGPFHAFLFKDGQRIDLGSLGGGRATSSGNGINDLGQVVGVSAYNTGANIHAFFYDNGVMTDLKDLGGNESAAYDINNAGVVTGWARVVGGDMHAFLYANGVMTDLKTLGGKSSAGYAINDAGQVVGNSQTSTGATHAFLYSDGTMVDLQTLGGLQSQAWSINSSGQIVGDSTTASGGQRGFLYSNGVMTDLNTLVDPQLGLRIYSAKAINDSGAIIAEVVRPDGIGFMTVLLTPDAVPEPSSLLLGAIGVGGVLVLATRRRRGCGHTPRSIAADGR